MNEYFDESTDSEGLYVIDVVDVTDKEIKNSIDIFQNKIDNCENNKVKKLYQSMLNNFFIKGENINESYPIK